MKPSLSRLPTLLLLLIMHLLLHSCKSIEPTILHDSILHNTKHHETIDTIYQHDSIFIREILKGDTVYLTRTEYRDRWRTRVERDTIVDIRVEKELVQLPPERYVPKFYKWCTGLLFAIGILLIGYGVLRYWILRR